ncbi:MAG: hypothetical protein V5A57_02030 [Candidatus Paceibacterota bacterium]
MKNKILKKIGIGVILFIATALYLSVFNFLYGYGFTFSNFFSLFTNWWLIALVFVLVFVYPYIKIDSQSILKRGIFFGLMAWLVDLAHVLSELTNAFIGLNVLRFFLAIEGPVFFIILGLVISFSYKKILSSEFTLSLQKSEMSFTKTVPAIIVVGLVYLLFMFFAEFWVLKQRAAFPNISVFKYVNLLVWSSFVNPLILGSIFTVLYSKTIDRIKMGKIKKWFLFSIFLFFLTEPLIVQVKELSFYQFWKTFPEMRSVLIVPHLLAILVITYILVRFLGKSSSTGRLDLNSDNKYE